MRCERISEPNKVQSYVLTETTPPPHRLPTLREDLLYLMALTKIPKIGSVLAKNLIGYCGGAELVFQQKKSYLLTVPGIGEQMANAIVKADVLRECEREIKFIDGKNLRAITFLDGDYPVRFQRLHDSPVVLYTKGEYDLNYPRTVAIVGTRKPTAQGTSLCEEIIEDLKPYAPYIYSGLAYGIDATAHQRALEAGLTTIGVLGHGFGTMYPAAHRGLAQRMCEQGGLLSEYSSSTKPDTYNFPMRNRLVAGLSDVVIVVESAKKGGSLITARAANRYGQDVFAVPGRVRDKKSEGCNDLIRTQQAHLFQSVADLAELLGWSVEATPSRAQRRLFLDLSELERSVLDVMEQREETPIDLIALHTGKVASELAGVLLELEFKGLVRMLPGKRFVLK